MRNQTDMMREILTNETAKRIISYVSPIYGNSYAGLWIYQAIGSVLDEICKIADQLRYETNPATSELLLDYWEDHYGMSRGSDLTAEQRQSRILAKIVTKGQSNPETLAAAVSSILGGVPVEIIENVEKNTFLVKIGDSVSNLTPGLDTIETMKPAHLVYQMQMLVDIGSDLLMASAVTHAETHRSEVVCEFYETVETGLVPASAITHAENFTLEVY